MSFEVVAKSYSSGEGQEVHREFKMKTRFLSISFFSVSVPTFIIQCRPREYQSSSILTEVTSVM